MSKYYSYNILKLELYVETYFFKIRLKIWPQSIFLQYFFLKETCDGHIYFLFTLRFCLYNLHPPWLLWSIKFQISSRHFTIPFKGFLATIIRVELCSSPFCVIYIKSYVAQIEVFQRLSTLDHKYTFFLSLTWFLINLRYRETWSESSFSWFLFMVLLLTSFKRPPSQHLKKIVKRYKWKKENFIKINYEL